MSKPLDTAVIMAAGMGVRLGTLGAQIPKGFLRLGEVPIVQESVERLVVAGVRRVIIVTGHLPQHYHALRAEFPGLIELVHNPQYAESGSMYSLHCARHLIDGDFLLLESDIVYEQRALTVVQQSAASDIVLCSGPTRSDDEVWVSTRAGVLIAMSKQRDELDEPVLGELVGICRISAPLFEVMCEEAERAFATSLRMAYETECLVAAATRHPIDCLRVDDLVWCEIDHADHLVRARELIYPVIHPSRAAMAG